MSKRARTVTTKIEAHCLGCDWTATTSNAQGLAAIHHDCHGHAVQVLIRRQVTYGTPDGATPGQVALDGLERTPA
jgi:hypothetical protein